MKEKTNIEIDALREQVLLKDKQIDLLKEKIRLLINSSIRTGKRLSELEEEVAKLRKENEELKKRLGIKK